MQGSGRSFISKDRIGFEIIDADSGNTHATDATGWGGSSERSGGGGGGDGGEGPRTSLPKHHRRRSMPQARYQGWLNSLSRPAPLSPRQAAAAAAAAAAALTGGGPVVAEEARAGEYNYYAVGSRDGDGGNLGGGGGGSESGADSSGGVGGRGGEAGGMGGVGGTDGGVGGVVRTTVEIPQLGMRLSSQVSPGGGGGGGGGGEGGIGGTGIQELWRGDGGDGGSGGISGGGRDERDSMELVRVSEVVSGSPAYMAGVRRGDQILSFGGIGQPSLHDIREAVHIVEQEKRIRDHHDIRKNEGDTVEEWNDWHAMSATVLRERRRDEEQRIDEAYDTDTDTADTPDTAGNNTEKYTAGNDTDNNTAGNNSNDGYNTGNNTGDASNAYEGGQKEVGGAVETRVDTLVTREDGRGGSVDDTYNRAAAALSYARHNTAKHAANVAAAEAGTEGEGGAREDERAEEGAQERLQERAQGGARGRAREKALDVIDIQLQIPFPQGKEQWVVFFEYGAVVFFNCDERRRHECIASILPFCTDVKDTDNTQVRVVANQQGGGGGGGGRGFSR
jgi:hypothetical protein